MLRAAARLTAPSGLSCRALCAAANASTFDKILVANRGEIACRVMRTAKRLGVKTVAVYSDADRHAQHVQMADEAYHIGPPKPEDSYLRGEAIVEVAKRAGAQAIHPGYGFLSENLEFAQLAADNGVTFIGPPVDAIRDMASKSASKDIMIAAGVPVTPSYHGDDQSLDTLQREADALGYPVLVKAVMGGGGKGMRLAESADELPAAVQMCQDEAASSFGDSRVLIERFLRTPRHVELQVFADQHDNAVYLFERDCSVQRRHQKVLEEAPAPHLSDELRADMGAKAVAAARAVGYEGAGTVEFMLDEDGSFYFMEMNTRLQVEHPVTEMITGQDLVEWQLKVAAGQPLPVAQEDLAINGHAIEARVYAEDPANGFLPQAGHLRHIELPELSEHVRVDTGVRSGDDVSIFYDPMISKLIVWGEDRDHALRRMTRALSEYQIVGLPNNLEFLAKCCTEENFARGGVNTSYLDVHGDALVSMAARPPPHAVALAALRLDAAHRAAHAARGPARGDATSPWFAAGLTGLRVGHGSERTLAVVDQSGAEIEVTLAIGAADGQFTVSFEMDGQAHSIAATDCEQRADGTLAAILDGKVYQARGGIVDGTVLVHCPTVTDGDRSTYAFDVPAADYSDDVEVPSVESPMPGRVANVYVQPGDAVEKGQKLVEVEAMKMLHEICAPRDGVVEHVLYAVDDNVEMGAALVQLAEEE